MWRFDCFLCTKLSFLFSTYKNLTTIPRDVHCTVEQRATFITSKCKHWARLRKQHFNHFKRTTNKLNSNHLLGDSRAWHMIVCDEDANLLQQIKTDLTEKPIMCKHRTKTKAAQFWHPQYFSKTVYDTHEWSFIPKIFYLARSKTQFMLFWHSIYF